LLSETVTGKTQVIKKFTSKLMLDKSKREIGEMLLSATTTAIKFKTIMKVALKSIKKEYIVRKTLAQHSLSLLMTIICQQSKSSGLGHHFKCCDRLLLQADYTKEEKTNG
jgi:hypothetical protein